MPIVIKLNGEPCELPEGSTLLDVLATRKLSPTQVAIERNHEIVPRATYNEVRLLSGDQVEVVSFVGGG